MMVKTSIVYIILSIDLSSLSATFSPDWIIEHSRNTIAFSWYDTSDNRDRDNPSSCSRFEFRSKDLETSYIPLYLQDRLTTFRVTIIHSHPALKGVIEDDEYLWQIIRNIAFKKWNYALIPDQPLR